MVVTNKRNRRLNSHTVCHATRSFRAPCAEAKKAGGSRARAVSSRAVPRASPLRGAQYIALDVRAHHPHDVRRVRRAPRARAPAGRARRVAGRQARREHRRRPGRDAHGRRALGAVGPHRRHGRYAGIGFRSAAPLTSRAERSAERRKSVRLRPRASLARRLSRDDRLYPLPPRVSVAKGTLPSSRDVFRFDDESFLRRRVFF